MVGGIATCRGTRERARQENIMGFMGYLSEADDLRKCYRGQYSDAVLSELENQNDKELEGISGKVKMLKDVRDLLSTLPLPSTDTSSRR